MQLASDSQEIPSGPREHRATRSQPEYVDTNPWLRLGSLIGDILEVEGQILMRQLLAILAMLVAAAMLCTFIVALIVAAIVLEVMALSPSIPPVTIFLGLLVFAAIAMAFIVLALQRRIEACNITFPRIRESIKESMTCMEPLFRR